MAPVMQASHPGAAVKTSKLRNRLAEIEVIEFGWIDFSKLEKLLRGAGRQLQRVQIGETPLPFGVRAGPITAVRYV